MDALAGMIAAPVFTMAAPMLDGCKVPPRWRAEVMPAAPVAAPFLALSQGRHGAGTSSAG